MLERKVSLLLVGCSTRHRVCKRLALAKTHWTAKFCICVWRTMTVRSMTYCGPATMLLRVSIYCMALLASASADEGRSLQGSTAPDNVSSKLMIHVSVNNLPDANRLRQVVVRCVVLRGYFSALSRVNKQKHGPIDPRRTNGQSLEQGVEKTSWILGQSHIQVPRSLIVRRSMSAKTNEIAASAQ